jgi:hypothetical protein
VVESSETRILPCVTAVCPACGRVSVPGPSHTIHPTCVPCELRNLLSRRRIPDDHGAVIRPRRKLGSVTVLSNGTMASFVRTVAMWRRLVEWVDVSPLS